MTSDPDDIRMSLGEHLEELRTRLFMGLIGPVIIMAILLFFSADIVWFLCQPVQAALLAAGSDPTLRANDVTEMFGAYIRVAFVGGLILGIPWMFYQLWKFVAPGLYHTERRFVTSLIPGSIVLAIVGLLFMYYVMLPLSVYFLVGFSEVLGTGDTSPAPPEAWVLFGPEQVLQPTEGVDPARFPILEIDPADPKAGQVWIKAPENELRIAVDGGTFLRIHLAKAGRLVEPLITLGSYISFVMWLSLASAVAFQLPLVMLMLAWATVVDYALLRRGWRWAIMLSVVAGAALSPGGDIFSMIAFTVPLYLLYEFGLVLVRWFASKRGAAVFSGADNDPDAPDGD